MVNVFQKFHAYLKNLLILFPKGDRVGAGGDGRGGGAGCGMDFLFLWEKTCKNIFFAIFCNNQDLFRNIIIFTVKNLKYLQLFSKKVISSNISRKDMPISLNSSIEF
jgi:hypothetical protein